MPLRPMYPMSFMFFTNGIYYYSTYCCDPNDPHEGFAAYKNSLTDQELGCPVIIDTNPESSSAFVSPGAAINPRPTVNLVNSQTMHVGFGDGPFPELPLDLAGVRKNGNVHFGPFCREVNQIPNVRLVTGKGDSLEDRIFTLRRIDISWPSKRQVLIAESARALDPNVPNLKTISITGLKTESDGKTIEMGLALTEDREPIVIVNQFRHS